jgi:moderate conductance mechanosensitive channel
MKIGLMFKFLEMTITLEDSVAQFLESSVRFFVILLVSVFLVWFSDFSIRKIKDFIIERAQRAQETTKSNFFRISLSNIGLKNRADTLESILKSLSRTTVFVLALISILSILKVDVAPLAAGAGIVGIIITLGTQSLVKDLLTGSFILIENQFDVGDVITINNLSGTVEEMSLRTTILRSVDGNIHIIPNGQINVVTVLTEDWSRAVLDIPVAQSSDIERVTHLLENINQRMREEEHWKSLILEDLKVLGVESFAENAVTIRSLYKTIPGKQWEVAREFRRRVQETFIQEGITIPPVNRPGV